MFYYREENAKTWTEISAEAMGEDNLRETLFGMLRKHEFQDSDGGYQVVIEFFDGVTGERTYAAGDFTGWYHNDDDEWVGGNLGDYAYGDFEKVKQEGFRPVAFPFSPGRDWLLLSSHRAW